MIRLHGEQRLPLVPSLRRRPPLLRRRLDVVGRVLLGDDKVSTPEYVRCVRTKGDMSKPLQIPEQLADGSDESACCSVTAKADLPMMRFARQAGLEHAAMLARRQALALPAGPLELTLLPYRGRYIYDGLVAGRIRTVPTALLEELDLAMQRPPSVITPEDGEGARAGPSSITAPPSSTFSASDMFSPGQLMTHLLGTPTPAITPGLSPGTLNELGNMLQSPGAVLASAQKREAAAAADASADGVAAAGGVETPGQS